MDQKIQGNLPSWLILYSVVPLNKISIFSKDLSNFTISFISLFVNGMPEPMIDEISLFINILGRIPTPALKKKKMDYTFLI